MREGGVFYGIFVVMEVGGLFLNCLCEVCCEVSEEEIEEGEVDGD